MPRPPHHPPPASFNALGPPPRILRLLPLCEHEYFLKACLVQRLNDGFCLTLQVYPASKIFALLSETTQYTRNQKSRAEALSEMAALTERLGLEQVTSPKGLWFS